MPKPKTREAWLEAMVSALRPKFRKAGLPIPKRVRVSCGWPSSGAVKERGYHDGECWPAAASEGDTPEIFISPRASHAIEVAAILVHELIHAGQPGVGHGIEFKRPAIVLGLTGKMTCTVPTPGLRAELAGLVNAIGDYPHAKIKPSFRRTPKQTTRLLKAECPECGYVIRVTGKWVRYGLPTCSCGGGFEAA